MDSADLYRNAFVLDCNALESFGHQFDDAGHFVALADSGVTALKTTLGGANGTGGPAPTNTTAAAATVSSR